jgi:hypothetical protein
VAPPLPHLLGTAVALAAALNTAPIDAQVRVVRRGDERLVGITRVDVVVGGLDETAVCGVRKPELQQQAVAQLVAAGLRASASERDSSWFYSVRVDVRSQRVNGSCATALATDLIAHGDAVPEADRHAAPQDWGSLLVGEMTLIHDLALVSGRAADHAAAVAASLAAQTAAIGERIRTANRRRPD